MDFMLLAPSLWSISLDLLVGFLETLKLFFVTLAISLPLGLIIAFGSMSKIKPLKFLCSTFVWVIRGTPLMLQLIIVYYGPGLVFGPGTGLEAFTSAALTFGINYACYFSEIYRGGIESISKGQYEAGKVLGMKNSQIFFRVILMQVIKRILAPMSNEVITLVKDTSLARMVTFYEVIFFAERYIKQGLLWPLFYTAVYYLVFTALLTLLFRWLEKKLSYYKV